MAQNISVPDIGDFKDVEVIEVLVKPGDQINKNDPSFRNFIIYISYCIKDTFV